MRFECQTCPCGPYNNLCETCYRGLATGRVKHPHIWRGVDVHSNEIHNFSAFQGCLEIGYETWLAVAQCRERAPQVADRFVIRPEFQSGSHSFIGTYGFAIRHCSADVVLFVTALHVLDELAKNFRVDCSSVNKSYSGQELPNLITRVILYNAFVDRWMFAELGFADSMLVLPRARIGEQEPNAALDIAAFIGINALLNPARIAVRDPSIGEPVWLVVKHLENRSLQGVVVEKFESSIIFKYAMNTPVPKNSSGAPVINAAGEVVGINVGAGFFGQHWFGYANPATSIRLHLDPAFGVH